MGLMLLASWIAGLGPSLFILQAGVLALATLLILLRPVAPPQQE